MASYPIAPWLRPADTTSATERGYGIGLESAKASASIEQARAQMQAAAQKTQLSIALQQQSFERDSQMEQQKLEVAKSYHDQLTQLKQEQLDQEQQKIQQQTQAAARKYSAQAAVQRDYQALLSNDPDMKPEQAIIQATMMHAGELGGTLSGMGALGTALSKMRSAEVPEPVLRSAQTDSGMTDYLVNPKTGHFQVLKGQQQDKTEALQKIYDSAKAQNASSEQLGDIKKLINASINKKLSDSGIDPTVTPTKQPGWLESLFNRKKTSTVPTANEEDYEVLTKNTKPVKDKLYRSPVDNQLYMFNGEDFVKPMSPAIKPDEQASDEPAPNPSEEPESVEA